MTAGLPAKGFLVPLGLTAATIATDAAIEKKLFQSGTTALIVSNKKKDNIIKLVKSFEESGLFIKGVSETITNEAK